MAKTVNGNRSKFFRCVGDLGQVHASIRKEGKVCKVYIGYSGTLPSDPRAVDRLVRKILQGLENVENVGFGGKVHKGFVDAPSAHYNTKDTDWTFKVYVKDEISARGVRYERLTGTPVTSVGANRDAQAKSKRETKAKQKKADRAAVLAKVKAYLTKKEYALLWDRG